MLRSTPLRAGDAQAKKMRRPSCRPGVGLRGWPHCRGGPEDPYAPGKIYCPGYPRAERLGSHTRDLMVWSLVLWWPSRAFAPCRAIAGSHKTHAQSSPGSCYGLSSVASSAHSQSPTPVPKVHIEGAFRETHEPVSTPSRLRRAVTWSLLLVRWPGGGPVLMARSEKPSRVHVTAVNGYGQFS